MNEGKKIVLLFVFLVTVGSLWVSQDPNSDSSGAAMVMAIVSGAAFLWLLLFWDNGDAEK